MIRLEKQSAFFEGRFQIDKLAPLDARAEQRVLLSLIMMLLLERRRG